MKEEDYSRAIEVFSGSPWEAEIIKGLLESNDIRCVIKDGIMGTLAPYIAPSVSVLVTEDQYEAATELITIPHAAQPGWFCQVLPGYSPANSHRRNGHILRLPFQSLYRE